MARPSPSAQRVVTMLNFFADNPGRSFSMTDLIRALKLNRATAHCLLAELVQANYLFRTSDKQYLLGSAAARLGTVASAHLSPLQVAQPEMRALANEFDAVCSALFRDRDEIVVQERAASAAQLDWYPAPGFRWPLHSSIGPVFLIGLPPREVHAWLDSLAPPLSSEERQRAIDGMTFAQAYGFIYVLRDEPWEQGPHAAEWRFMSRPVERRLVLGGRLESGKTYSVATVGGQVSDGQGRVAFVLALSAFPASFDAGQIMQMGLRVRQACEGISRFFQTSRTGTAVMPR